MAAPVDLIDLGSEQKETELDSSSVPGSSWPFQYCAAGQRASGRKSFIRLAMKSIVEYEGASILVQCKHSMRVICLWVAARFPN